MPIRINPIDARTEQEIFADLRKLATMPGYVHVLGFISWRDNYVGYSDEITPKEMAKSYADDRLLRTEFVTLLGLMIQDQVSVDLPDPLIFQDYLDRTTRLLAELHASFNKPLLSVFRPENIEVIKDFLANGQVLREPIFYGGEAAHSFQFTDLAGERYADDDDWLVSNMGFSSGEMQAFVRDLTALQERKLMSHSLEMRKQNPSDWTFLPAFRFDEEELLAHSNLSLAVIRSIIAAFSTKPGFEDSYFNEIGDFNIISAKPLIEIEGYGVVCFEAYNLAEAIYDSPFYWMQADAEYRTKAQKHRGTFTENFAYQSLVKVFDRSNVHKTS